MRSRNKSVLLSLLVIALAIPVTILALPQQTHFEQSASQVHNINSAVEISNTKNPDGSMGSETADGNFSNSLTSSQTGDLTVFLINTSESDPANRNVVINAGPQPVSSLQVTVNKIEVYFEGSSAIKGGYWETLNIGNSKVVDLAQLSKTNTLESFGLTHLASGRYTEVRVYITRAIATLPNGQVVKVNIDNYDGIIAVKRPFNINVSRTTNITLDIDSEHSVVKINGQYYFKPVVVRFLENI